VGERGGRTGRRRRTRSGYRTKNKNPTRQCGEKSSLKYIEQRVSIKDIDTNYEKI
jgi:hypothetical protein